MENKEKTEFVRPGLCCPRKKDLPTIKKKLKSKITIPTFEEIRRTKEPLYSTTLKELFEAGYAETGFFIENLIQMENDLHEKADNKLKRLDESPKVLARIVSGVKKAESFMTYGLATEIIDELMDIGNELRMGIPDFKWISEHILRIALAKANRIVGDNREWKAKIHFSLGMLYSQSMFFEEAVRQFNDALQLSHGQEWRLTKTSLLTMFNTISLEMSISLCVYADSVIQADRHLATTLCDRALKIAKQTENTNAIGKTYASYANILTKMQQHDKALKMYEESYKYYRVEGGLQITCQIDLKIAACYLSLKEPQSCIRQSNKTMKIAAKYSFKPELAEAYEFLGHGYRLSGENAEAAVNYTKAVELYYELGEEKKMSNVRCLAASAIAQEITPIFIKTILKSDKEKFGDNKYMSDLLEWQDSRKQFWQSEDGAVAVDSSTETYLSDSETTAELKHHQGNRLPNDSLNTISNLLDRINLSRERTSIFRKCRAEAILKRTSTM